MYITLFTQFKRMIGSITLPSFFVVRCRWGPVDIPVLPDTPIISPALTYCPIVTLDDDK